MVVIVRVVVMVVMIVQVRCGSAKRDVAEVAESKLCMAGGVRGVTLAS
jgi:hypothetical protein